MIDFLIGLNHLCDVGRVPQENRVITVDDRVWPAFCANVRLEKNFWQEAVADVKFVGVKDPDSFKLRGFTFMRGPAS